MKKKLIAVQDEMDNTPVLYDPSLTCSECGSSPVLVDHHIITYRSGEEEHLDRLCRNCFIEIDLEAIIYKKKVITGEENIRNLIARLGSGRRWRWQ